MNVFIKMIFTFMVLAFASQSLFAENLSINTSESDKYIVLLLEMENKLEEHVVKAEEAILRMEENNISDNITSELTELVLDLKDILETISVANNESLSGDEAQEIFEESKIEIIEISKEFRTIASSAINTEIKDRIKEQMNKRVEEHREKFQQRLEERKEEIEQKEIEFLVKRSENIAEQYNISEISELSSKLENGTISKDEFISELKNLTSELNNTQALERIEKAQEKREEVKEKRIENLERKVQEKRGVFEENVEKFKSQVSEYENATTEEIVEKIKTLDDEQKTKISKIIKQDISDMNDDELTRLVNRFRPLVNGYFARSDVREESTGVENE